jgi:hypothetical protein
MVAAILQSNYIPWKGYFDIINTADVFIFYDHVQYTKNDWRNRNRIKTPQGSNWLSIPVRQFDLNQKIEETHVLNQEWRKKHWATLRNFYGKTPGFKLYKDLIEPLYLNSEETNLSKINQSFITTIQQILGGTTKIYRSTEIGFTEGKTQSLVDLCQKVGADTYLSGPAAKDYLDVPLFENVGMKVQWMTYDGYPEYTQPFPPFDHAVSILDLIFCTGTEARNYLKAFSAHHDSV